jgi:hypothetical protein
MPLALIALASIHFRLRLVPTLVASVVGEWLGLFLYAAYHRWRVSSILSGKASGAVGYVGTEAPRGWIESFLMLCVTGLAVGLFVLSIHWIYARLRSL